MQPTPARGLVKVHGQVQVKEQVYVQLQIEDEVQVQFPIHVQYVPGAGLPPLEPPECGLPDLPSSLVCSGGELLVVVGRGG